MEISDRKEIIWEAEEYEHHEKTPGWYWITVLIALALGAYAVWQDNYLFLFFIVVAEVMVFSWARRYPRILVFRVTDGGVHIDNMGFYPYGDIEAFSIVEYDKSRGELILRKKAKISQPVKIPAHPDKLHEIRLFLENYLSEEDYKESFPDMLYRAMKF